MTPDDTKAQMEPNSTLVYTPLKTVPRLSHLLVAAREGLVLAHGVGDDSQLLKPGV
jgi:hypothetical protein